MHAFTVWLRARAGSFTFYLHRSFCTFYICTFVRSLRFGGMFVSVLPVRFIFILFFHFCTCRFVHYTVLVSPRLIGCTQRFCVPPGFSMVHARSCRTFPAPPRFGLPLYRAGYCTLQPLVSSFTHTRFTWFICTTCGYVPSLRFVPHASLLLRSAFSARTLHCRASFTVRAWFTAFCASCDHHLFYSRLYFHTYILYLHALSTTSHLCTPRLRLPRLVLPHFPFGCTVLSFRSFPLISFLAVRSFILDFRVRSFCCAYPLYHHSSHSTRSGCHSFHGLRFTHTAVFPYALPFSFSLLHAFLTGFHAAFFHASHWITSAHHFTFRHLSFFLSWILLHGSHFPITVPHGFGFTFLHTVLPG